MVDITKFVESANDALKNAEPVAETGAEIAEGLTLEEIQAISDDAINNAQQAIIFGTSRLENLTPLLGPGKAEKISEELNKVDEEIMEAKKDFQKLIEPITNPDATDRKEYIGTLSNEQVESKSTEDIRNEPSIDENEEEAETPERIEVRPEDIIFTDNKFILENLNETDRGWLENHPDLKQKLEEQIDSLEDNDEKQEAYDKYRNKFNDNVSPEEEEVAKNFEKEAKDEINSAGRMNRAQAEALENSEEDKDTIKLIMRVAIKVSLIVASELAKRIAKDEKCPKELSIFLDTLGNVLAKSNIQDLIANTIVAEKFDDPEALQQARQKFVGASGSYHSHNAPPSPPISEKPEE